MRAETTDAKPAPTLGEVLRGVALRVAIGPAASLVTVVVWVAAAIAALAAALRTTISVLSLLGVLGVAGGAIALAGVVAGVFAG